MADEDEDEMRPEYDFSNAAKNPHAAKLRAGTPCRLLECADGARKPITNTIEWLSDDELAANNRALVETTQRWWPIPAQEREDLMHEVGLLAPNACIHGQNKRQCEICGLESQVAFWHDEVNRLEAMIPALTAMTDASSDMIQKIRAAFDQKLEDVEKEYKLKVAVLTESNQALGARIQAAQGGEADALALVLSHEAHIAELEAANRAWLGKCEQLKADVDFAARKLMPAHDLLVGCMNALVEEQPADRHLALRGKIVQWLGSKAE